jgi:hypothetical protein
VNIHEYGGFHKWEYPKWMIYNGNPIEMDDFGVPPIL